MGKRTNTAVWSDKHSRWQINVQYDGRRRSFYSGTLGRAGQRECNAKADSWLDEGIDGGKKRIEYYLSEYFEQRVGTVAPETLANEKARSDLWIKPCIGHKRLEKLTEGDLQDILNQSSRKGIARDKGLSKKSIANLMAIIKQFLKYCRRKRYTSLNPEFLEVPRSAISGDKRILQPEALKILFASDTVRLYNKVQFDSYVYAYRFSVLTGLRPGEIIGLRWSDISGDTVSLKRSVNQNGRETRGKNDNARRAFIMTDYAKEVLQLQRQISTSDSVFEIDSQSTYRHRFKQYCESNQIPYVSPYELRHTFVSVAKSLPDGELRQLVGHSRSMDTYGVYSHEMQDDKRNTADNLNAIWGSVLTLDKNKVC